MKTATRLAILLISCSAAALAGCSGGEDERSPDVLDGERKQDPDFVTTLAIKDANGQFRAIFAPGEQIHFELSVTNRRDEFMTVTRASGATSDFIVAPAGTRSILWRASYGFSFTQAIEMDEFAPGETKIYGAIWDQARNDGLPLLPGEYVARGFLAVVGISEFTQSEFGSDLIPFAIN